MMNSTLAAVENKTLARVDLVSQSMADEFKKTLDESKQFQVQIVSQVEKGTTGRINEISKGIDGRVNEMGTGINRRIDEIGKGIDRQLSSFYWVAGITVTVILAVFSAYLRFERKTKDNVQSEIEKALQKQAETFDRLIASTIASKITPAIKKRENELISQFENADDAVKKELREQFLRS